VTLLKYGLLSALTPTTSPTHGWTAMMATFSLQNTISDSSRKQSSLEFKSQQTLLERDYDNEHLIECPEASSECVSFVATKQRIPKPWLRSTTFFWLHCGLISFFGTLVLWFYLLDREEQLNWQGNVTGFVPAFSRQVISFQKAPQFISNHIAESSLIEARGFWKTLVPRQLPSPPSIMIY
jgi:hypothetical protein